MKTRPIDKLLSIVAFLVTPFFFVSISALIPCIFRNFYIWQIDLLKISETSGFTKDVIIEAFNDVMNFIWNGAPFKTGQLAWTENEMMHFADCIPLFWLQLYLACGSGLYLLTYFILIKVGVLRRSRLFGLSSVSYGGIATLGALGFLGIFAAIDFNQLFVIFHKIAFPGKDNWYFDYNTEQVIRILPESFFFSCAIFIIGMAIVLSVVSIIVGFHIRSKDSKIMMKKLS